MHLSEGLQIGLSCLSLLVSSLGTYVTWYALKGTFVNPPSSPNHAVVHCSSDHAFPAQLRRWSQKTQPLLPMNTNHVQQSKVAQSYNSTVIDTNRRASTFVTVVRCLVRLRGLGKSSKACSPEKSMNLTMVWVLMCCVSESCLSGV